MNTHAPSTPALTAALLAILMAGPAMGQEKPSKKVYCWEENGATICGDALPADAVDNERTEFNASGMPTRHLERAPTSEERAALDALEEQAREAAAAAAAQERRELAMVESYASEADLQAAFANRIDLLEASIRTSRLSVEGLRDSLVVLLQRAGDAELAGKAVPKPLTGKIQGQHRLLRRQQQLLASQQLQRTAIDDDLATALERYRELKDVDDRG